MSKQYLLIYESSYGDIFKKVYDGFTSKKEVLAYFKEHNTQYGYKVLAIRKLLDSMYL